MRTGTLCGCICTVLLVVGVAVHSCGADGGGKPSTRGDVAVIAPLDGLDERVVGPGRDVGRVAAQRHLEFTAELVDGGKPERANGCQIQLRCFPSTPGEAWSGEEPAGRLSITCDAVGCASAELPADTAHVWWRAHHEGGFAASGVWDIGQHDAVTVQLRACASIRAVVRGRLPTSAAVLVAALDGEGRLREPLVGGAAVVQRVPVAWSPVAVSLRCSDGGVYRAAAPVALSRGTIAEVVIDIAAHMGSVRGVLVGDDGSPIEGASVLVYEKEGGLVFDQAEHQTNAVGAFSFEGLPNGVLSVSIAPAGYARRELEADLTRQPSVDLGQVVATRGHSVLGEAKLGSVPSPLYGGALPVAGFGDWGMNRFPCSGPRASIDDDGSFRIDNLAPGSYLVWCADGLTPRSASWSGKLVTVVDRDVVVQGLAVSGQEHWTGAIRTSDRAAWPPGSRCLAMGLAEPWWSSSPLQEDGRTELHLGRGDWVLGYSAEGCWRWIRRMSADERPNDVRAPDGRVTLIATRPIGEEVQLQLVFLGGRESGIPQRTPINRNGIKGSACSLVGLASGRYRLLAFHGRVAMAPIEFAVQEGGSLVLPWPAEWE